MSDVNIEVTKFLDDLHHPLRPEIEQLRLIILSADGRIKNGLKQRSRTPKLKSCISRFEIRPVHPAPKTNKAALLPPCLF